MYGRRFAFRVYNRESTLIGVEERPCDAPTSHSRHPTECLNADTEIPGKEDPGQNWPPRGLLQALSSFRSYPNSKG